MSITKDSELWLAALTLVPDKYTPQLCDKHFRKLIGDAWPCKCGASINDAELQHTLPPPDISPDLLYAILEAGLEREPMFLIQIDYQLDGVDADWRQTGLRDAIIRAAASLREAK